MSRYDQFQQFRTRMNRRILEEPSPRGGTLVTRRFFALDDQTYREPAADAASAPGGAGLDKKTKELLGLVASLVLRCDDCVAYHVDQCVTVGCTDRELWDCFDVGLIVGGSIVIPHLRRALDFLDECREREPAARGPAGSSSDEPSARAEVGKRPTPGTRSPRRKPSKGKPARGTRQ